MGSFIVGTQSWYLGQNKFGCEGVDFGPSFHPYLKHPVYGIVILWLGIYTDRPNFPSYVLSSIQWIHPFLSRFIPENKLLASVPCFQKIRLLFTNDLYFLTITCRPPRSFFLFTFCFIFIYVHYNYTPVVLYEENLSLYIYIFIHDKLFLCTH